ncbi:MAG: poly(A) polymerase, partial [Bdellovibrionaceae bacterium]|nr:poly(A) polymerase [Pseudobdellovibrionaceae bacterium]
MTPRRSQRYTCDGMEVKQKPQLHQDWIDSHAYGIVKALQKGGFTTYLVGGCVRDLLIGIHPKDFDIATAAQPPQVKRLIYQAYIIGKRFRLVLVKRNDQQFEVATFRREVRAEDFPEGVPFGDNVFGSPEEDASRRDFTINGLFYDPIDGTLIDYIDGMRDIQNRIIRMIGDPEVRLIEDPIRMLRALRLAHKIGFSIEAELRTAIQKHASELLKSVLPRRREEVLKILRLKEPDRCLLEAFDLDLLKYTLPTIHALLGDLDKREIFLDHMRRNHRMAPDSADTVHLFGWLVFSLFQTVVEAEGRESERPEDIIAEDRFQNFMRDELGMYKFEQSTISHALETVSLLQRAEEIRKRGERRQFAVVKNEGFLLGLCMAEVDYQLTPEDLHFWKSLYDR